MSKPTAERLMDRLMDGPHTEPELASQLGLRTDTISRVADNLVSRGLIVRKGRVLEMARTRRGA